MEDEKIRVVTVISRKKHPELFDLVAPVEKYYRSRKLVSLAEGGLAGPEMIVDSMQPGSKRPQRSKPKPKPKAEQEAVQTPVLDEPVPTREEPARGFAGEPGNDPNVLDDEEVMRRKQFAESVKRSMSF